MVIIWSTFTDIGLKLGLLVAETYLHHILKVLMIFAGMFLKTLTLTVGLNLVCLLAKNHMNHLMGLIKTFRKQSSIIYS